MSNSLMLEFVFSFGLLEVINLARFITGDTSDETDIDRLGTYGGVLFVSIFMPWKEVFRIRDTGEGCESTVDDNVDELEVLDVLDLFVLDEDPDEDILRDFSASKELLERLLIDGVSDGDDNSLDARYALNCCSDSAGVMDLSGLRIEFFEFGGNVSFHISS